MLNCVIRQHPELCKAVLKISIKTEMAIEKERPNIADRTNEKYQAKFDLTLKKNQSKFKMYEKKK